MTKGSTIRQHASLADIHTTNKYLHEDREDLGRQQPGTEKQIHEEQTQPNSAQVHVDAAINQVPARYEAKRAGLGIHIQGELWGSDSGLLIQAIHHQALDPLHAEALARQLASEIIQTLGAQEVVYHTDSQILAGNLNSTDPIMTAPDWRIRPVIAKILSCNESTPSSYKKISRIVNITAHSLAKFAFQANISSCNFSCTNVNHIISCPVLLTLASHQWDVFTPISVNCC
jgi:hypothetical protein